MNIDCNPFVGKKDGIVSYTEFIVFVNKEATSCTCPAPTDPPTKDTPASPGYNNPPPGKPSDSPHRTSHNDSAPHPGKSPAAYPQTPANK